jgi:hypothetical protein
MIFFFEVVNYDYHDNKYILQIDEEDRSLAEFNNWDYNAVISSWSNLL